MGVNAIAIGIFMMKKIGLSCTCILLAFCMSVDANAAESVMLKGLFGKKSALIAIDGEDYVLKIGKKKQGVLLVAIEGQEVVISVNKQKQRLSLSKQLSVGYKEPESKIVRIASQRGGHYWVKGHVNGGAVDFMVDTGATSIAMNQSTARRLGVDYTKGEPVRMSTANGITQGMRVVLNKVTIGAITQYNIPATVSLNNALSVTLLGNSFLSGVDMRTENGVLILEAQ